VYNWPHNKKLLKLAIYSACQVIVFTLIGSGVTQDHDSGCKHWPVHCVPACQIMKRSCP
jgi:hypothetical protein